MPRSRIKMLIWRVIRNWKKKNMCLIRGTWRRKEKKDILTNKMLQQQRKLSKQQPTVHWRIFGLSWPFLFSQSVALPAWQKNERKTGQLMMQLKTWICLLQFALIGICYYPKSLWKKNWLQLLLNPVQSRSLVFESIQLYILQQQLSNMIWCLTYG